MKKYAIKVRADAYATVVVEAPTPETALDYLTHNFESYNLDFEVDEMCAEVEGGIVQGGVWGVTELGEYDLPEADYVVDTKWLEENGYEVVITVRKRETA